MKLLVSCMVLLLVIISANCASANESPMEVRKSSFVQRVLQRVWSWMKGQREDTFVGRCFGVAKKLKFFMPIVIFKLGVMLTTLGFLTIFSLKSLGLLVLLLVINSSGLAAKLSFLKGEAKVEKPQNVHFHIHQSKNGLYSVGPSSAAHEGYWDRSELLPSSTESLADRLNQFDIQYDPYR